MAETTTHRKQMVNLIFMLARLLVRHPRVFVGGNLLMYYTKGFGWDHISPDVFVTFDVEPGDRKMWQTWNEGDRFADVVFEITSPSTVNEDRGKKRRLYARLGVRELYLYDPLQEVQTFFQGYRLIDGDLAELPPPVNGAYFSAVLGAELRVIGPWLRVIDPVSGEPLPTVEELDEVLQREAAARKAEAAARRAAEEREQQAEAAHTAAEQQREAAEAALREALAELARLRGEG
jgi:Uma2 family endonuclease